MEESKLNEVEVVEKEEVTTVQQDITAPTANVDELIYMAEQAEKRVVALDKIIKACFKITTKNDWVLIGGKPYLTESGTTKVANLIGISFEIVAGFPICEVDSKGYKTYTYRVRAYGKTTHVEGEGSRSMKEDFFNAKGKKQPEEIKDRDVKIAALTNAKNNAIKSIIPGLKNVEIQTLVEAGINLDGVSGYSFNEGKQGGVIKNDATTSGFKCECCGQPVTSKAASYSQAKYNGHVFCYKCDHSGKAKTFLNEGVVDDELPEINEPNDNMPF